MYHAHHEVDMIARFSLCILVAGTLAQAVIAQPCSAQAKEKVTGIGGVFFRARDPAALAQWYEEHLGITRVPTNYETQPWMQLAGPTVFAPFRSTTDHFGRPEQQWMINFRVRDLDAMVRQLRSAGIDVTVDPTVHPNGRFARLHDPEGNPIELWQPNEK
jgi:predicted enzyme related to lactoylglutathione lyase